MSFLIDTDICSAHLKGVGSIGNRFLQYGGRLFISAVCVAELSTWVARRSSSRERAIGLDTMLSEMTVLSVDERIARLAGQCRGALLDHGQSIATADLLIACTALAHDLTLVTHNVKHFNVVEGLRIEDWLAG